MTSDISDGKRSLSPEIRWNIFLGNTKKSIDGKAKVKGYSLLKGVNVVYFVDVFDYSHFSHWREDSKLRADIISRSRYYQNKEKTIKVNTHKFYRTVVTLT